MSLARGGAGLTGIGFVKVHLNCKFFGVDFPGFWLVGVIEFIPGQAEPIIYNEGCVEPEVERTVVITFR